MNLQSKHKKVEPELQRPNLCSDSKHHEGTGTLYHTSIPRARKGVIFMYEQFKNQFALSLAAIYTKDDIEIILRKMDIVAYNYDIQKKETSVVVYNSELPEMAKTFMVCKKIEGMSEGTLYNYGLTLQKFFLQMQKPPEQITPNDVRVYLYRYQEEHKISNRSLDKLRQTLNNFFQWASCEGYLPRNPMITIKPIKFEKKPRQPLTQIELEYIRQACQTPKERAMVEFMYSTGCRVSEMAVVKKSDINWNTKEVRLFGKGKKHRTSFLNAKAEVALLNYFKTREDDNDYVLVSDRRPHNQMHKAGLEKIVRNLAKRASEHVSKPVSPHVFRHTTATTAMNSGMPVEDISILLGHASIATTMIYAKTSMENIRSGHKKYVV